MKTRKQTLTLIFAVVASIFFLNCTYVFAEKGSGKVVKQERKVGSFNEIDISSAFTVYLKQGNKDELVVEIDENLQDNVISEMSGETLKVYTEGNIKSTTKMNLYITFKMIDEIDISGAVKVIGENKMNFRNLDFDASGASEVKLELDVAEIRMDLSGASDIKLIGKGEKFKIDCSGSSDVNAPKFEVDYCNIEASGASEVVIFVNKELVVEASGASEVKYKGNPIIDVDVSGASEINRY